MSEPSGVTYEQLLERVIADGIAACTADYANQADKRDGAVRGFNDCRGKSHDQLSRLLGDANMRAHKASFNEDGDYWYWRCRALEIEWVCNVVSAALRIQLAAHLPTVRGAMKVAEIVGVSA